MKQFVEMERALRVVTDELKYWKSAMDDLAYIFHQRFPPRVGQGGWTLHVRRCGKSKNCRMCPHSIIWARYAYVRPKEETKKRRDAEGKSTPAFYFFWSNKKNSRVKDGLPKYLFVKSTIKVAFKEFEEIRAIIMLWHRNLANMRKRILARQREAQKKHAKDPLAPVMDLEKVVVNALAEMLLANHPSREHVLHRIQEMRKKYPPKSR